MNIIIEFSRYNFRLSLFHYDICNDDYELFTFIAARSYGDVTKRLKYTIRKVKSKLIRHFEYGIPETGY